MEPAACKGVLPEQVHLAVDSSDGLVESMDCYILASSKGSPYHGNSFSASKTHIVMPAIVGSLPVANRPHLRTSSSIVSASSHQLRLRYSVNFQIIAPSKIFLQIILPVVY